MSKTRIDLHARKHECIKIETASRKENKRNTAYPCGNVYRKVLLQRTIPHEICHRCLRIPVLRPDSYINRVHLQIRSAADHQTIFSSAVKVHIVEHNGNIVPDIMNCAAVSSEGIPVYRIRTSRRLNQESTAHSFEPESFHMNFFFHAEA